MSNCGKWLTKTEFEWCVIKAMTQQKALFSETPSGDENRHWMYSKFDEFYQNYVEWMQSGDEDWFTHLCFGKKMYELYVMCDDHKGEYSYLRRVKRRN